jgi:hypothetical protein
MINKIWNEVVMIYLKNNLDYNTATHQQNLDCWELIYHTVKQGICVLVAYDSNPGQEIHYVDYTSK